MLRSAGDEASPERRGRCFAVLRVTGNQGVGEMQIG